MKFVRQTHGVCEGVCALPPITANSAAVETPYYVCNVCTEKRTQKHLFDKGKEKQIWEQFV